MAIADKTLDQTPTGATYHLRVHRSGTEDSAEHFDLFEVPADECTTVLDALRWIQLNRDPSLSLRHSCYHASCGTCGMRVNGREELACVCELADEGEVICVEPLDNVPTLTDVVVDMDPFYERFPAPHPLIRISDAPPDGRPADGHEHNVRLEDCLECALCLSACPIAAANPGFVGPAALHAAGRLLDEPRGSEAETILSWAARPEGVWQCTTCRACVDVCPADIAHIETITDLRGALVERGEIEPLLAQTLQKVATQGNSYGKSARMRARWTRGLDFTIPDARTAPVEYLWFVGDFASFDERVQDESQRLARLLHDAGVSFGLLFEGEHNAGNDVRRAGEEGLFELLAEHNMAALAEAQFDAIFTTDPHSLNALRNDYRRFGLDKPVFHYTELLLHLAAQGTIAVPRTLTGMRVTYHDPCYLARYNDITDPPRRLIGATGAELVEMPRHGANTFCCGAGGGRIWMAEDGVEERPSEMRIREAEALGDIDYFVVSCPKDLTMYTAAAETVGNVEFEVIELTSLIERALAVES